MIIDVWDTLSIIGTIAFALPGAIVIMEEDFDILGLFILGFVTAFGGDATRNPLTGLPVSALWSQGQAFYFVPVAMLFIMVFPNLITHKGWRKVEVLTDTIGLTTLSVQGTMYVVKLHQPLSAVIVAAVLTGAGGGIVRDVLVERKPEVLRSEVYAGQSILAALAIYLKIVHNDSGYYLLVLILTILRMIGYWRQRYLSKIKRKVT